jgi:hypothetical protein
MVDVHDRRSQKYLGYLLAGVGMLFGGAAALIFVVWMMASSVQATPFDADGVRCYRAAESMSCIKTDNPAK